MKRIIKMSLLAIVIIALAATLKNTTTTDEPLFVDSDNVALAQGGCVATANWSCYAGGGYPFYIIEGARYQMPIN